MGFDKIVITIMAVFSALGALDRIFGNRLGLGKSYENGIKTIAELALSMVGIIVLAPVLADLLEPVIVPVYKFLGADAAIFAGTLLACDMGGAPLAAEIAGTPASGGFNGLVVASMMGTLISFSPPLALGVTRKDQHPNILLGLMCGIITIPLGCIVSALMLKLPFAELCRSLVPLILFSAVVTVGLIKVPQLCLKVFGGFGKGIKVVIVIGLVAGLVRFLTGFELLPHLEEAEKSMLVVFNASCVMSGAFPLLYLLGKVMGKPLKKLGGKLGINEKSALGFMASLATNVTTFGMMDGMDEKGVVLNSAFAVSAAFVFAGHMAFTMSFDASYYPAVMAGKLVAGVTAVFAANLVYKLTKRKEKETV